MTTLLKPANSKQSKDRKQRNSGRTNNTRTNTDRNSNDNKNKSSNTNDNGENLNVTNTNAGTMISGVHHQFNKNSQWNATPGGNDNDSIIGESGVSIDNLGNVFQYNQQQQTISSNSKNNNNNQNSNNNNIDSLFSDLDGTASQQTSMNDVGLLFENVGGISLSQQSTNVNRNRGDGLFSSMRSNSQSSTSSSGFSRNDSLDMATGHTNTNKDTSILSASQTTLSLGRGRRMGFLHGRDKKSRFASAANKRVNASNNNNNNNNNSMSQRSVSSQKSKRRKTRSSVSNIMSISSDSSGPNAKDGNSNSKKKNNNKHSQFSFFSNAFPNTVRGKPTGRFKTFPSKYLTMIHFYDDKRRFKYEVHPGELVQQQDGNGQYVVKLPICDKELMLTVVPVYNNVPQWPEQANNNNNNHSLVSLPPLRMSGNKKQTTGRKFPYGFDPKLSTKTKFTPADWEPELWKQWVPENFMEHAAMEQWIKKCTFDRPNIFRFIEIFKKCSRKKGENGIMNWFTELGSMKEVCNNVRKYLNPNKTLNPRSIIEPEYAIGDDIIESMIDWQAISKLPLWQSKKHRDKFKSGKSKSNGHQSRSKSPSKSSSKTQLKTNRRKTTKSRESNSSDSEDRSIGKRTGKRKR